MEKSFKKPIIIIGLIMIFLLGVLIIDNYKANNSIHSNIEYFKSKSYTLNNYKNVEFIIDYSKNDVFNKVVEKNLKLIIKDNEHIFSNKEKKILAKLFINKDFNIASYVFIDDSENFKEVYGTILIDLENFKVIDKDSLYYNDLAGLSMLVRDNVSKDLNLKYKKELYLNTTPEVQSFKHIYFSENQIKILLSRSQINENKYTTSTFDYLEVMPFLSNSFNKRLDSNYKRQDISNIRYIDPFKPMIVITLDDGPTSSSIEISNLFNDYNSSLTFFFNHNLLKDNLDIIKEVASLNHEVGSLISNNLSVENINDISNLLKSNINQDVVLMRPNFSNNELFKQLDNPLILWSIDPEDWKYHDKDVILKNIIDNISDGKIILLHDLKNSKLALKDLLEEYSDVYQFVSVSEMFAYKGIKLENSQIYRMAVK